MSDSDAVKFLSSKHHVAADYQDAVRQVVEAGLNVRTNVKTPESYLTPLRTLIEEGKISMKTIDARVADVLALLDKNMNWTVELGVFKVMIGSSSEEILLSEEVEVLNMEQP